MPIKLPKIIGHRGACGYAPENTIESILTAADMGIDWVELDVMLTRDNVPVIFHDDTLERTTNGFGNIADMTWDDLQQLDAGSWFGESFAGARIPSLDDVLDVIITKKLGLNLEIKPTPGREKETAEVALDALSRVWDDHSRLLISSFQLVSLETAKEMAPDWYRGLLLWHDDMPENWADIVDYLDVTSVNISQELATREMIEEISDMEKAAMVYTVNDAQDARRLRGWGVDTIFTDVPDIVREAMIQVH